MTFLKVMAFSLATMFAFTIFANILPQVQSDAPTEEEVDVSTLDQGAQIAWGERLFGGKGSCSLCHKAQGRAPDVLNMDLAATFLGRLADSRYTGEAKGAEGAAAVEVYIRESMVVPSAFVVAGFGKKGTNDEVSPMPKVDAPPASLSGDEINAITAYLQDQAGMDVTVPLPSAVSEGDDAADEEDERPVETAQQAVEKYFCSACHALEGSDADVGPALGGIGARLDRTALRQAILDPNAEIAEGYEADMMPLDFAEQMRVSELDLLVDYLAALPATGAAQ